MGIDMLWITYAVAFLTNLVRNYIIQEEAKARGLKKGKISLLEKFSFLCNFIYGNDIGMTKGLILFAIPVVNMFTSLFSLGLFDGEKEKFFRKALKNGVYEDPLEEVEKDSYVVEKVDTPSISKPLEEKKVNKEELDRCLNVFNSMLNAHYTEVLSDKTRGYVISFEYLPSSEKTKLKLFFVIENGVMKLVPDHNYEAIISPEIRIQIIKYLDFLYNELIVRDFDKLPEYLRSNNYLDEGELKTYIDLGNIEEFWNNYENYILANGKSPESQKQMYKKTNEIVDK